MGSPGNEDEIAPCDSESLESGTVKSYSSSKGFGFISCPNILGDLFFLRSEILDLQSPEDSLRVGCPVAFDMQVSADGRNRAVRVRPLVAWEAAFERPIARVLTPQFGVVAAEPVVHRRLPDGSSFEYGIVKSFSGHSAYGFLARVDGSDVYFQTKDLRYEAQKVLMAGGTIVGRQMRFGVDVLADGKQHARDVELAEGSQEVVSFPVNWQGAVHGTVQSAVPCGVPGAAQGAVQCAVQGAVQGVVHGAVQGPVQLVDQAVVLGVVTSYVDDENSGFISVDDNDIFFHVEDVTESLQQLVQSGIQFVGLAVQFRLEWQDTWCARTIGLAPVQATPSSRRLVGELVGTVKLFKMDKGFGFLNVLQRPPDLYFQLRDLPDETQQSLAMGANIVGATFYFSLEALPTGKFHARRLRLALVQQDAGGVPSLALPGEVVQKIGPLVDGSTFEGTVKSYDECNGHGFLTVLGEESDVYFQRKDLREDLQELQDNGGSIEGFLMQFQVDLVQNGVFHASSVKPAGDGQHGFVQQEMYGLEAQAQCHNGVVATPVSSPRAMVVGALVVGTVKAYYEERAYGFVNVQGCTGDIYFQKADISVEVQGRLQSGASLVGATVCCRLERGSNGRWRAKQVGFVSEQHTETPQATVSCTFHDGAELVGTVKSFHDQNGYGFITVSGQPDIYFQVKDLQPEMQQQMEQGISTNGATVRFTLGQLSGGRWRARSVSVVSADQSTTIPSDNLPAPDAACAGVSEEDFVGTIKTYSAQKRYGFISIPTYAGDIYFQAADLVDPMQLQGQNIVGAAAHFRPEVQQDGRWRAKSLRVMISEVHQPMQNVHTMTPDAACVKLEPPENTAGGSYHAGTIKFYNDAQGFGFITSPNQQEDIYFEHKNLTPESQAVLGGGFQLVGSMVHFCAECLQGGIWHAHTVVIPVGGQKRPADEGQGGPALKAQRQTFNGAEQWAG